MNPLVAEKREAPPILVVDKIGTLGEALAEKFSNDAQVVFVSERQLSKENIINVSFEKKFPTIPENFYSTIFIVDNADKITGDLIPSFLKKVKNDRANISVIAYVENKNIITEELLEYKNAKLIFFGDLIDKNIGEKSAAHKIINQTKIKGKIEIPGDGMQTLYPVFFEDIVNGILEATFSKPHEKIFYLFPKFGITILSFANMIHKANPTVGIDFVKGDRVESIVLENEGAYLLPENYPLEEKIRNLNLEPVRQKDSETEYKKYAVASKSKGTRFYFFFLILFLFLPLIVTLAFSIIGYSLLNLASASFKSSDFDKSKTSINLALDSFSVSNNAANFLIWETNDFQLFRPLETSSDSGFKKAVGISNFFQGLDSLKSGNVLNSIESFKDFLVFNQNEKLNNSASVFLSPELTNLMASTLDIWPQILGYDYEKNYLILFEDNNILRPGGGLIKAYGVLTLDKGEIKNFLIGNVDDLDSKLVGHVEPPFPIRRYVGNKNMYLKDSNFDLDSVKSASTSAFLFNLETGNKIDGVVGVDLNFIKSLLERTGPIYIKDFNLNISSDNLSDQIEKKDNKFFVSVIETLKDFDSTKLNGAIFGSLENSIANKDLTFASSQKDVQNILTVNNLSNNLWDERQPLPKNINDTLGINEANLAQQSFLKRKIFQNTTIGEDGTISTNLSLNFTNSGSTDYKSYLRYILPNDVTVKSVKIDGQKKDLTDAITDPNIYENPNFSIGTKLEIESYNEDNKSVIGFLVNVPKGKTQTIELSYSFSSPSLSSLGDFIYSLKLYKQPGVDVYPYTLNLSYPKTFKVLSFPDGVNGNDGVVSFQKNLSSDYELDLNFAQK